MLADDDRRAVPGLGRPAPATAAVQPSTGPDLKAMTQHEFYRWATGQTGTPATAEPTEDDGRQRGHRRQSAALSGVRAEDFHADVRDLTAGEAPGTTAQVLRSTAVYLEGHSWMQAAMFARDVTATARVAPAAPGSLPVARRIRGLGRAAVRVGKRLLAKMLVENRSAAASAPCAAS